MIICFVGPANSAHIVKWCRWFTARGHEIHVISFTKGVIQGVDVHLVDISVNTNGNDLSKLRYLFTGKKIKRIINSIKPDIINVHYATSYGAAMALSNIKGYVLSVWGSDIYEFPNKSPLHKYLLKYSLKKAEYLFSTSRAMAKEAAKYTNKQFSITPFGVDVNLFNPNNRSRNESDREFVVGTVKSLSDVYGINKIIEAVAQIKNNKSIPIKLRIAGKGPKEEEYRQLAIELGIDDITEWLGFISQKDAAKEWANMDVAIIPSISESFGVSAVEAQACGTAVIISDAPGLLEATNPDISSIVVENGDVEGIVEALVFLASHDNIRKTMGERGRQFVENNYEINNCFEQIETLFISICQRRKS